MTGAGSTIRGVARRNSRLGSIRSTTSPCVVLSFDDGPDPVETPRVLDVLDRHGATGTFFVLLTRARRQHELLTQIVERGHEVGLHGPDHRALSEFGHRVSLARTRAARAELEQLAGRTVRWFRPPYGSQTLSSLIAVERAGLTSVLWNATTWDWKDVTNTQRLEKAASGAVSGAILLAHDGLADESDGADETPPAQCDRPALLDEVLTELSSRGLRGCSLGDALRVGRPVRTLRVSRRRSTPTGDY